MSEDTTVAAPGIETDLAWSHEPETAEAPAGYAQEVYQRANEAEAATEAVETQTWRWEDAWARVALIVIGVIAVIVVAVHVFPAHQASKPPPSPTQVAPKPAPPVVTPPSPVVPPPAPPPPSAPAAPAPTPVQHIPPARPMPADFSSWPFSWQMAFGEGLQVPPPPGACYGVTANGLADPVPAAPGPERDGMTDIACP